MGMDLQIWAEFKFDGEEVAFFDKSKKVIKVRRDLYETESLFEQSGRYCWPLWNWCNNNLEIVKAVDVDDTDAWELTYEDVKKLCDSAKSAYEAMAAKAIKENNLPYYGIPYGRDGWDLIYNHWEKFDISEGQKFFPSDVSHHDPAEQKQLEELYIWVVYSIADKCHPWAWYDDVRCYGSDCKFYMTMSH